MPAYDNPPPPSTNWGPPLIDFSPLAQLPEQVFQGQQRSRTLAIQNEFKDGLPTLTDQAGNPVINPNTGQPAYDINQIMQRATKTGGLEAAMPLLNIQMTGQAMGNVGRAVNAPLQPQDSGQPGAQPQSVPAHGIPLNSGNGSSSPAAQGQQPDGIVNTDTLSNVVYGSINDPKIADRVITAAAGRLGIDKDAPIDPNNPTVMAYIKTANGGVIPNGGTAGRAPGDNGTSVAQPSPATQPGMDLQTADALEARARNTIVAANAAEAMRAGAGAGGFKAAQADFDHAKQIREVYAKNAEMPPEQKLGIAAGTPNPLDYQAQLEQNKLTIERGSKLYSGIQAASRSADDMRPHLQAMTALLQSPQMYSGTASDAVLGVKRLLANIPTWMGGDPNAALPMEGMKKVLAQNILNATDQLKAESTEMGSAGGRIFQQQIQLMKEAGQTPDNSLAALRFLTELGNRSADHLNAVGQMASQYKGGRLDPQFDVQLQNYNHQYPMFTTAELANPKLIAPPVAPATLQNPNQIMGWASKAGLKTGDPFKTPDGRIKYMP